MSSELPFEAEAVLWPHEPGIEQESDAAPLLHRLREALDAVPLEAFRTPAEMGRSLGAKVVLARLIFPREGWTWYQPQGPLIEIADWLTPERRPLVVAHELCHVILGPPPERHDLLTERVCNWGAGAIMRRLRAEI